MTRWRAATLIEVMVAGAIGATVIEGAKGKYSLGAGDTVNLSDINPAIDGKTRSREKITISTFMIAQDPYLINFVEELTKANKGRVYYSSLNNLGQFLFVDYIRNRRKKI